MAKNDAVLSVNETGFLSLGELIDFSVITEEIGLDFIDMPEFVRQQNRLHASVPIVEQQEQWCAGGDEARKKLTHPRRGPSNERCEHGDNGNDSYEEMARFFNETCSDEVALIGSAFVLPRKFSEFNPDLGSLTLRIFYAFPPSEKLLHLSKVLIKDLPRSYAGVHIRFPDKAELMCMDTSIEDLYSEIGRELQDQNVSKGSQVLLGNSNPKAKECFKTHLGNLYPVVTINDLIDQSEEAQRIFASIKTDRSAIFILLDQILLSVSDVLVMKTTTFQSTFQRMIDSRRESRSRMLEILRGEEKEF